MKKPQILKAIKKHCGQQCPIGKRFGNDDYCPNECPFKELAFGEDKTKVKREMTEKQLANLKRRWL